jgi:hypothetical protein
MERLFACYVERQFAQHVEYQEQVMTRRLTAVFRAADVLRNYQPRVFGNENYRVTLPFVSKAVAETAGCKAIKPLDLAKSDNTKIVEHGDRWLMRIKRLRDMNDFPDDMLFVVRQPKEGKRLDLCQQVCDEFKRLNVRVLPYGEQEPVLEYARAV